MINVEKGEYIIVKKNSQYINSYQIRKFEKFENSKIICFNRKGNKLIEYDFYQKIIKNNLPNSGMYMDSNSKIIDYSYIEKMNTFNNKK